METPLLYRFRASRRFNYGKKNESYMFLYTNISEEQENVKKKFIKIKFFSKLFLLFMNLKKNEKTVSNFQGEE